MTEPALPSPSPSPPPVAAPAAPAVGSPPQPSSPVTTKPATPAAPTPAPTGPATAPAIDRPAWLPETFADGPSFRASYDELAAFRAADQVRRSTLPPSPNDYKAELPADFQIPDGIKYEFNTADPLLAQAQAVAHEAGLSQQQFSKLLALYAGGQVSSQQQIQTARNAEVAKLGATGPARIDALTTFFRAYLGEQAGNRRMGRIFTAQDVADAEMEVSKITSQGGAAFRGNGREPPQPAGRLSREQIDKLTPAQKLDYSRQFDQSSMPAWRDPRG